MGWFSQLLGEARNLDVLTLRITLHTEPDADPVALESLYGAVALQRSDVMFRLASALGDAPLRDRPQPHRPARRRGAAVHRRRERRPATAIGRYLRRPWRNVRRRCARFHTSPTEAHLHTLRIRSKELRYASELAAGVFGRRAARLAATAAAVQDRLGDHRDALAAEAFLTRAANERFECAFIAGQLVVIERLDACAVAAGSRQRPRRPEAALEGLRPVAGHVGGRARFTTPARSWARGFGRVLLRVILVPSSGLATRDLVVDVLITPDVVGSRAAPGGPRRTDRLAEVALPHLALRRRRQRALRAHHLAARVLPDASGTADPPAPRRRHRRAERCRHARRDRLGRLGQDAACCSTCWRRPGTSPGSSRSTSPCPRYRGRPLRRLRLRGSRGARRRRRRGGRPRQLVRG